MNITGHTGLFALFGSPVGHSGSPAMYNYSFEKLGLDYVYVAIDIGRESVGEAVSAARLYNLKGFNLTMPCKNDALLYMDELSVAAKLVGAVNTVVNEDGRLTGHITDGTGFLKNLEVNGVDIKGKKMVIAGGGGAATAIAVQSALDGAAELTIFSRKEGFFSRTLETAERIKKEVPDIKINVYCTEDTAKMTEEIRRADIFVNATTLGMKPNEAETAVKDVTAFHKGLVVADIVYNPVETRLLREAGVAGCICIGGKGMLLWQGVYAFKLFTGRDMPVEEVRERFF